MISPPPQVGHATFAAARSATGRTTSKLFLQRSHMNVYVGIGFLPARLPAFAARAKIVWIGRFLRAYRVGGRPAPVFGSLPVFGEPCREEALLKYDDAQRSGLFSKFWIVTPTYYRERQIDPWIVGEVAGSKLCAVIAS